MQHNSKSFVYFICSVSAMGGLLFGYDWVVIGGAKPFYELFFGIADQPVMQGVAMSTALVGCLVGAMVAGALADRYGRKPLLTTAAVLFTLSAVGTGVFNDFSLFNIARFIGGVGIGVASALSPMYIAEVSPTAIRGRMVSLNQMTIVLGILGAQIVNMLLARDTSVAENMAWNVAWGWRWMFWAETVPAALFLVMSFMIPESPVYLKMKAATMSQRVGKEAGLKELLQSKYGKVLLLGLVIAVFQQWCGTNVIFNYAQEIFTGAGYDVDGMFIDIVITGIANVAFTFVALYTIEKWGRRTLMLIGAGGLGLIYLTLGTCYFLEVKGVVMVCLVVTAISIYAMTLGPVTWTLLAEIFPNRIRGVAIAALGSSGTFWIYSGICLVAFIFLWNRCPETKGKTLEQLEKELVGPTPNPSLNGGE